MIALLLVTQLVAGYVSPAAPVAQLVTAQANMCQPAPIIPTAEVRGDSLMQGGSCAGNTTTPATYFNTQLTGAVGSGWIVAPNARTGDTAAAIRNAYTAGSTPIPREDAGCLGKRCKVLIINGGTNSLRVSTTPQATHDDMYWVVLDALSKGRYVVWVNVPPYGGWGSAGINPLGQATSFNTLVKASCDAILADTANPNGYAKRLRCPDVYTPFEDPANLGKMVPSCTCDGAHFVQSCANTYTSIILAALLTMF